MAKDIDICYGMYASKWGLTDFYEESEKKLKDALASGEEFDTGWFGCKKEINYARYLCEDGQFHIMVSAHMDELIISDYCDLIDDARCDAGVDEEELCGAEIEDIAYTALESGIDDHTDLEETIPAEGATFERIVEITNRLEGEAMKNNDDMYAALTQMIKDYVAIRDSNIEQFEKGEQT